MVSDELLAIIGLIYDAVIDPAGWAPAMEAIRVRHGWFNGSMSVLGLPSGQAVINVALNVSPDFAEIAVQHVKDVMDLWGGPARVGQLPLEEPIRQSDVTDAAGWMDNPYFRDWISPQGIVDQVAIVLVRDRMALANIAFGIHKTTIVTPSMLDELRVLAPHLRRAAIVARVLEHSAVRAATFEAALDSAQSGAVLVRGDMVITHANAAANEMLRNEDPIRSTGGRLRLSREVAPGQLEAAVSAAAEGAAAIGRKGIGIPARRGDGSPMVAHVMPLEPKHGAKLSANAVVLFSDDAGGVPPWGQSLELLFGLTPAETRAFELVATGKPSAAIAREMGVAESTLRTHLLRVYDKTGRHSRAAIVQLARELKLSM